jgi:putative flippase GtrA
MLDGRPRKTLLEPFLAVLDASVALLSWCGLSERFIRFAVVGLLGLCWDTGTVYALRGIAGLYVAGTVAFVVAASANWVVNRIWTFRGHNHAAPHVQWAKFLAANAIGFVFNRGTFFILISISALCHNEPVLAIVAGSIVGIFFNYFLSKRFVFS